MSLPALGCAHAECGVARQGTVSLLGAGMVGGGGLRHSTVACTYTSMATDHHRQDTDATYHRIFA